MRLLRSNSFFVFGCILDFLFKALILIYIKVKNLHIAMIGRVYKITNSDESIVYIGSTIRTLNSRWAVHMGAYGRWELNNSENACSIFHHFQEHGVNNFAIHLISEHEIEDQRQLHQFEQLIIDRTACVNARRAYRSPETKIQQGRDNAIRYQRENWTHIQARNKQRIECGCGKLYTYTNKARHERCNAHQLWLARNQ
jgi:hypothetical protein